MEIFVKCLLIKFSNKILKKLLNIYPKSSWAATIKKFIPHFDRMAPITKLEVFLEVAFTHLSNPILTSITYQAYFSPKLGFEVGYDYEARCENSIEFLEQIFKELGHPRPRIMGQLVGTIYKG